YLCWAPEDRRATMTYFITIAGRRWPVEITFKTGKDTLGWDTSQARTWDAICRHTALTALAQLRTAAIRAALTGTAAAPATGPDTAAAGQHPARSTDAAFDLQFYRYGAPVPVRGGQPCPPGIPPIELSATEAARIERLARDRKAGLLTTARLAFHLRWSEWRRHHQARARWHHYAARLQALAT
ncbi:MAG TPA: transposase, partial [Streptosporangiaceae bacterium]|nr:transposase [Streptosporangiaceae bacterium]